MVTRRRAKAPQKEAIHGQQKTGKKFVFYYVSCKLPLICHFYHVCSCTFVYVMYVLVYASIEIDYIVGHYLSILS